MPNSPDFIPDDDLAKHEGRSPAEASPDFISDDELPKENKMGWGEYLGRGATAAIPYVAGAGGATVGALGTPVAPVASTLAGGGLGYAGGKEIQSLLNHYLFGDENESTSPMDQLKRVAGSTKEGVEQEMGGQVLGKTASQLFNVLPRAAEAMAVRHLRPTPTTARVLGKDRLREIGRDALDSGAIQPFGKAESTLDRISALKDSAGKDIGNIVDKSTATADPVEIAAKFDKEIITPLKATSGNEALIKHLEGQRDSFLSKYAPEQEANALLEKLGSKEKLPSNPMSAKQLEAQKQVEQSRVNYNNVEPKLNQQAQSDWAKLLKEHSEGIIDDAAFLKAKRAYGNRAAAEGMLDRTSALTDGGGGLMGHLADMGVNLEGLRMMAHGNPLGLGMVGLRALTKGRVASTAAKALDALGKALPSGGSTRNVWNQMLKGAQ